MRTIIWLGCTYIGAAINPEHDKETAFMSMVILFIAAFMDGFVTFQKWRKGHE